MKTFVPQIPLLILIALLIGNNLIAQGVAINEDGSLPDNSAILDIQSSSKGVLIPKMSTEQKNMIQNPTIGLLVFDVDLGGFYFFDGVSWKLIGDEKSSEIMDTDEDTRVLVDQGADEDEIHFFVQGTEKWKMQGSNLSPMNNGFSIFIGTDAGSSDDLDLNYNTFIGHEAGVANNSGDNNSFVGALAGKSNTSGSSNAFFGNDAGFSNTTGQSNVFMGRGAGTLNTTGSNNSFLGKDAGLLNTSGGNNAFLGTEAGRANTIGFSNVFLGASAGLGNTSGFQNTFVGKNAGAANTTGSDNSFYGYLAGSSNTTGYSNAFFGKNSGLSNTTGESNAFFGVNAGNSNSNGGLNAFFGFQAGYSNTIGGANAFFGYNAGYSNSTGSGPFGITLAGIGNSFFGSEAGYSNIIGLSNTFIGVAAGYANTSGDNNTFIGGSSGDAITIGSENTFIGNAAGGSLTEGSDNTFVGARAGLDYLNSTGTHSEGKNTLLGYNAGNDLVNGNNITLLGANTYSNNPFTPTNSTAIGYASFFTASNMVLVGNEDVSWIGGYATWANVSDGRFKKNIQEDVSGLDFISKLKPVTYQFDQDKLRNFNRRDREAREIVADLNEEKEQTRYSGFIAQEVEAAAKEVGYDFSGIHAPKNDRQHYTVSYAEFVVPLVKAVQEQQEIIEELKQRIEALENN